MSESTARTNGTPTELENRLRERVLSGEATPGELEVWRSEVASRTTIRSAGRAQEAEIAAAIASRPVVTADNSGPSTKKVTHFNDDGGITNHTITEMGSGRNGLRAHNHQHVVIISSEQERAWQRRKRVVGGTAASRGFVTQESLISTGLEIARKAVRSRT